MFIHGTDPTNRDSDGDGFGDGVEINDGNPLTDPNNPAGPYPPPDGDLAPLNVYDGIVNVADYFIMERMLLGIETPTDLDLAHGDFNASGSIDTPDLTQLQQIILAP